MVSVNGIFIGMLLHWSCFLGVLEMSPHRRLSIYLVTKKEEKTCHSTYLKAGEFTALYLHKFKAASAEHLAEKNVSMKDQKLLFETFLCGYIYHVMVKLPILSLPLSV